VGKSPRLADWWPVVRQIVTLSIRRRSSFHPAWRKLFGLGLQADSSTSEKCSQKMSAVHWPGYKKKHLVIRRWFLKLGCHRITIVQPAESRKGLNLAFTLRANFCRPTCWRVLRESKVSPVLVIVEQVGRHQPCQMPLIYDNHVVQQVAPATSNPALRNPVLPWAAKSSAGWLAPHLPHRRNHIGSKLYVSVEKQESVWLLLGPGFSQLLYDPK